MSKVIKFNLRCDGNPVRTIEDLQENFSLEDVLSYYDNKLLHKWLQVREYNEELDKVNAITSDDQRDIIKSLATIFQIDEDPATLDEKITILNYERDKRNIFEKSKESEANHNQVIGNYFERYEQVLKELSSESLDRETTKTKVQFLVNEFKHVIDGEYFDLLKYFVKTNKWAFIYFLNSDYVMGKIKPEVEAIDGFYKRSFDYYTEMMSNISFSAVSETDFLDILDYSVKNIDQVGCISFDFFRIAMSELYQKFSSEINTIFIKDGHPVTLSNDKKYIVLNNASFVYPREERKIHYSYDNYHRCSYSYGGTRKTEINSLNIDNIMPFTIFDNCTLSIDEHHDKYEFVYIEV